MYGVITGGAAFIANVFDAGSGITAQDIVWNGRADALMWDDTVLLGIAVTDRTLKLTDDTFLFLPYGIGIKQGNTALKRWVDSRLNVMKQRDQFVKILRENVPARVFNSFSRNVLRPSNNFGYAQGDATTQCP